MSAVWRSLVRDDEGQDLVEYAFLLGFIAAVCWTAVRLYGQSLRDFWTVVSGAVAAIAGAL